MSVHQTIIEMVNKLSTNISIQDHEHDNEVLLTQNYGIGAVQLYYLLLYLEWKYNVKCPNHYIKTGKLKTIKNFEVVFNELISTNG